ncbi:MAG: S46 family peptidase [Bacteroidales bacterium]|nr:S46 family peptidase [Bacteroides sp.]MCM1197854.1 S46 family peptidase [Clostridium sp.]MCM1501779.1 S46 family peptidase [Bacteroidales bacterium]
MKKFFCSIIAFAVLATGMRADEGMWMLPLLQKMNGKAIEQAGCRLTPEQIYSINHSSLKDAIVQFGGGCTGEIISGEGLLVTNHHCGYGSIQKLSSVEHDYLTDGYWAMNRSEELPCEGLTVTFLEYMQDVTAVIEKAERKARKQFKGQENEEALVAEAIQKVYDGLIEDAEKNNPHCEANIVPYYDNNVYYLIVDKVYNDVRFVGAPPSSIGKFGADTDNWMWPRHTGDFSMFRVYADSDNNPAAYSPDNVPYTPKRSLKISLKGIQEGDYTMIMGYPGRTTRFQTSPELKFQIEQNDIRIAARTVRQNLMMEDMLADPKVKIQYASKYSGSSNGWKKWQGMKLAFDKLDIIQRAEDEEAAYTAWINSSKKRAAQYGSAIGAIKDAVDGQRDAYNVYTTLVESAAKIELVSAASMFNRGMRNIEGTDTLGAAQKAAEALAAFYKDYSVDTDRKISKAMLKFYRDNVAPEYYLDLGEDFAALDIDKYVDELFDNSAFTSPAKLAAAISEHGQAISDDPAFKVAKAISGIASKVYPALVENQEKLAEGRKAYTAGLLEWKNGEPSYPDANFTMRMTYGSVKPYSPKDAVIYRYYTTLDGVMEKEDPDNWEFVVPAKLKELWQNKDFGQYAMADGKMPVAFLSNNDITGGNSGSPVMNADGELIGLAFDGNWESMSSDVMFEPDLQRCINVDIRYVLFIVDKFGGAGYLLNEMDIVK